MTRTARRAEAAWILATALLLAACDQAPPPAPPTRAPAPVSSASIPATTPVRSVRPLPTPRVGPTPYPTLDLPSESPTPRTSPGTSASPVPTATPAQATFAGAAQTCAQAFGVGDSKITVRTTHRDRVAYLHVPATLPARPVPLVFMFHGFGGTAQDAAPQSGFNVKGDAEGFVSVYPAGLLETWHMLGSPNDPGSEQEDLEFFSRLLDRIEASGCIDMSRVFLTGHSMGGGMASYLACRFADRVTGAAIVAGAAFAPPCAPDRPVSVVLFYIVTDPIVPIAGGHIANTNPGYPLQLPADEVAADWAAIDHCDAKPVQDVETNHVLRYSWQHCDAPVVYYVVPTGSHDWPGSTFYHDDASLDLSATDVIWDFFAAAPPRT